MSNFDDFCKKNELTRNLDYVELAWIEGAQSRQQEVDELRGKLKNSEYLRDEHLEARRRLYKDNCELQKRIDDVLKFANDAHSDLNIGMLKMVEILKGAANET